VEFWTAGATLPFYWRELIAALTRRQPIAYWGYNPDGSRRALTEVERRAIRDEIKRLYDIWQETGELLLDCYCKGRNRNPDASCHGDCLARALQWIHVALQRRDRALGAAPT
jgi:hypothetical protein